MWNIRSQTTRTPPVPAVNESQGVNELAYPLSRGAVAAKAPRVRARQGKGSRLLLCPSLSALPFPQAGLAQARRSGASFRQTRFRLADVAIFCAAVVTGQSPGCI